MEPTIGVNDLIIVGPPHDLQLGDVLLYNDPSKDGRQTAHRLVGYEDDGSFRTKGDNNSSNDRHHIPLTAQHVVGEVKMVLAVPSIDRTSAPFLIALAVFLIALVVIFSGDKRDGGPDQKPVS